MPCEKPPPDRTLTGSDESLPNPPMRAGIFATVTYTELLKEYIDRAVHEALWIPTHTTETHERTLLATHVTSVIRVKKDVLAQVLIILSPRPEHHLKAIENVRLAISMYANQVHGFFHGIITDENRLRDIAMGHVSFPYAPTSRNNEQWESD